MTNHRVGSVSLDLPESWREHAVVTFAPPVGRGENGPSIVVEFDEWSAGQPVQSYVDKQLVGLARGLHEFDLQDIRTTNIAGEAGVELVYRWTSPDGRIAQRQNYFVAGDRLCIVTATAPKKDEQSLEMLIGNVLQRIRVERSS